MADHLDALALALPTILPGCVLELGCVRTQPKRRTDETPIGHHWWWCQYSLAGFGEQAAEILMKVKETKTPYEALIDNFEPKMTTDQITATFNQLQSGLKQLISKIQASSNKPDTAILYQPVPAENQRQIAQLLTQTLGYDTSSPAGTWKN